MLNVDAIESINVEQLATVTDRLLLRGGLARLAAPPATPEQTLHMRAPGDLWRRFTTTALLTALISVTAAIASLL